MSSTTPLNFAPYADPPDAPSQTRWAPPPPSTAPTGAGAGAAAASSSYHSGAAIPSYSNGSTGFGSSSYAYGQTGYAPIGSSALAGGSGSASGGGGGVGTGFETTMYRHDWEAAACYCLGPFGAAFMLIFEVENDYVRFHAYQSVLLNLLLVLLHFLFSLLFGNWAQYVLVVADFAILVLMSLRAYYDSDHLSRYKIFFIGELADGWVRAE
ncbi:hypothetical protein JCM10908_004052 [Rhodotorula pacifica]|uniref:uncharacterized protein n=1 Tax=Rhodotorula pacifica TaxID=1495444 RepID=UPI00317D7C7E